MKNRSKTITRRRLFQWGLGAASGIAAQHSIAKVCGAGTAPQALGPFFPNPETPVDSIHESEDQSLPIFLANDNDLTYVKGRDGRASGQYVRVSGVLRDKDCRPVSGATIIIWQASASGRYNHKGDDLNKDFEDPRDGKIIKRTLDPYFQSWGQATTNEKGEYNFKTIVPGFYPADLNSGWYRPPHIHFLVSATGIPQFVTQMYFAGESIKDNEFIQELNEKDFILSGGGISEQQQKELVVHFKKSPTKSLLEGRFDINLPE